MQFFVRWVSMYRSGVFRPTTSADRDPEHHTGYPQGNLLPYISHTYLHDNACDAAATVLWIANNCPVSNRKSISFTAGDPRLRIGDCVLAFRYGPTAHKRLDLRLAILIHGTRIEDKSRHGPPLALHVLCMEPTAIPIDPAMSCEQLAAQIELTLMGQSLA